METNARIKFTKPQLQLKRLLLKYSKKVVLMLQKLDQQVNG